MDTMVLRNIHVDRMCREGTKTPGERFRKVRRSPDEEFGARVERFGAPARMAESVVALILQKQKFVQVTRNGIGFEWNTDKYQFWHENSATCLNKVGEKVLVTFDPDEMSAVHVLTEDGRYVETVPQKGKVAWFDDEAMKKALESKARALNADVARFRGIHRATTEEKVARVTRNRERMQIVNTIGMPGAGTGMEHGAGRMAKEGAKGFERAEEIVKAQDVIVGQKGRYEARRKANSERIGREGTRVEELLGAPRSRGGDIAAGDEEKALATLDELT
jgi:hypothetical protein